MTSRQPSAAQQAAIAEVKRYGAHNYHPIPVVIAAGEGSWVTDIDGVRYLDCLAAYSAVNFGHGHPALVRAASEQIGRVTLTSRAFFSEPYGPFVKALAQLCGKNMVLPMNTGVEAVETGIKVARKWGYEVKGVPENQANIVVMSGNFHGRTTGVVSFSDDPDARDNYGPYLPGFRTAVYGDLDSLRDCIDDHTVAVLVEPIQGEAGVIVPPEGYLTGVRELTRQRDVLMIADEIQSGLGRCGDTFYTRAVGVVPDIYLLGKALGGGIVPLSAVVADYDVLGVIRPGQHGSTFGGNPLACAIGSAVIELLNTGEMQERSRVLGARLLVGLKPLVVCGLATAIRGAGLWVGLDVNPELGTARDIAYRLLDRGILVKDTHGVTLRFAPPLVITEGEVDHLIEQTGAALEDARADAAGVRPS